MFFTPSANFKTISGFRIAKFEFKVTVHYEEKHSFVALKEHLLVNNIFLLKKNKNKNKTKTKTKTKSKDKQTNKNILLFTIS